MVDKKFIKFVISIIWCCSYNAFAIRFLDFEECTGTEGVRQVRLVDFDTDEQKFVSIRYYDLPRGRHEAKYEGFSISLRRTPRVVKISCTTAKTFDAFALCGNKSFNFDIDLGGVVEEDIRSGHRVFWKNRGTKWVSWRLESKDSA